MPTAGLAKIELNIDSWDEITSDCGRLEFLIRPKDEIKSLALSKELEENFKDL